MNKGPVNNRNNKNNKGRKGKHLWTSNSSGEQITVYEAIDQNDEARYVAQTMLKLANNKPSKEDPTRENKDFSQFAILYRTRAMGRVLEQEFLRNGISCIVYRGLSYFEHAEVKDMLSYLWVINNRADDLRLDRIINMPPRGLGAKTVETAKRLAAAEKVCLYHVVSNPQMYAPLEKASAKLSQFSSTIESLAQLLDEGMPLPEFYEELMIRSGYIAMLESKPTEENKTRLENIRELKSDIINYVNNTDAPSLSGYLEQIALMTELDQENKTESAAVMMTMHAAKGLEFPHVFLVGFEDGLFPGMRAIGEREEMEEERRLCYVAITRAEEHCYLSFAKSRYKFGKTEFSSPSRFLKDIDTCYLSLPQGERMASQVDEAASRFRSQPMASRFAESSRPKVQVVPPAQPTRTLKKVSSISPSRPAASPSVGALQVGNVIEHERFGVGEVVNVVGTGDNCKATVRFRNAGEKQLLLKFARFKIIS